MKPVFKKRCGECRDCPTPVNEKYRIGDNLFCAEHYEKEKEKHKTTILRKQKENFDKLFQ